VRSRARHSTTARRCSVAQRTGAKAGDAELEPASGYSWQRFALRWAPERGGRVVIAAHAEARAGEVQPASERRNSVHEVPVTIA
jgi:hypothetical protein